MFSHVPVHFAILLGFSTCLGGGGAGGGDAARRCFFAAGFFGGAVGMRSSVAPLLMLVMRNAGAAFLAAGLREGHCGGAPPPLLPPYMLDACAAQICARSLCPQRCLNRPMDRFSTAVGESYQPLPILREQLAAIMAKKRAATRALFKLASGL